MGRSGGKSTWIAGIACAALDGPLAVQRGEILVVASSFSQGKIVFDHAFWFLKPAFVAEPKRWRIMDTSQMASIEDRDSGMKLIVLGSDSRRGMGRAPYLAILDEPREWIPSTSQKLYNSIKTGLGKIPGGRLMATLIMFKNIPLRQNHQLEAVRPG